MPTFADGKDPLCMCVWIDGERVTSLMCPIRHEGRLEDGHMEYQRSEPLQSIGKRANISDE